MFKKLTLVSFIAASMLYASSIEFQNAEKDFKRELPDDSVVLSYNSSVSKAKKSVVNIATKKVIPNRNNEFFNDPFFEQFFGFGFNIPQQRDVGSLGSGVIISKDGYIVTNNHVVEGADEVIVTLLEDDKEYTAKVIGTDPKTDIAVIKIEADNLNAIKFADSDKILEGDVVFAIGNPFGVGGTITQGIVSALNKNSVGLNHYENFIQTDASINPGNSGGALIDSRGALIGINSAILSRGGGNNGVGFAIPSNMVKDIAGQLATDGKIERGYIGVMIADLTKEQLDFYENKNGALVVGVEDDMPAAKAGIKRGDLIIKVENKDIKNSNELKNFIATLKPGSKAKVEYERGGKIKSATIELANADLGVTMSSIDGLELSDITPELARQFRLSSDINGVVITDVKNGSKAQDLGFMVRDVITQINDMEVNNVSEFNEAFKKIKGDKALVWIIRKGIPYGLVIE